MERRSLCQIILIVALIADHVDRRAGERATQRHKNDQGIVRRRPLVHREICAEGDAAQGPRQHDVHVPKSERGRPHAAERETARRGEWWKARAGGGGTSRDPAKTGSSATPLKTRVEIYSVLRGSIFAHFLRRSIFERGKAD